MNARGPLNFHHFNCKFIAFVATLIILTPKINIGAPIYISELLLILHAPILAYFLLLPGQVYPRASFGYGMQWAVLLFVLFLISTLIATLRLGSLPADAVSYFVKNGTAIVYVFAVAYGSAVLSPRFDGARSARRLAVVLVASTTFAALADLVPTMINLAQAGLGDGGFTLSARLRGFSGRLLFAEQSDFVGKTFAQFGLLLVLSFVLASEYRARVTARRPRLLLMALMLTLLFCVVLTFSQAPLVALMCYFLMKAGERRFGLLYVMLTVAAGALSLWLIALIGEEMEIPVGAIGRVVEHAGQVWNMISSTDSLGAYDLRNDAGTIGKRILHIIVGFRILIENPETLAFGAGYGETFRQTFFWNYNLSDEETVVTFLMLRAGIPALFVFAAWVWTFTGNLRRVRNNVPELRVMAGACYYWFVGFIVANVLAGQFILTEFVTIPFFALAGFIFATERRLLFSTDCRQGGSKGDRINIGHISEPLPHRGENKVNNQV